MALLPLQALHELPDLAGVGELATLRAFGYRRSTLARLVLAESAFLLAIGMLSSTVAVLGALRVPLLPVLKAER